MPRATTQDPVTERADIGRRLAEGVASLLGSLATSPRGSKVLKTTRSKGATVAVFDLERARALDLDVAYSDDKLSLRHRKKSLTVDLSRHYVQPEFRPDALTLRLEPLSARPILDSVPERGAPRALPGMDALQAAFLRQAVGFLTEVTRELDDDALSRALSEPSPNERIVRALQSPAAASLSGPGDPLLQAKLRGVVERERLLKEAGGALQPSDVVKILGITRQAVDKRRREGKLLALSRGGTRFAYPAAQFAGSGTIRDLDKLLAELSGVDGWTVLAFLLSPNEFLGRRRPIDVLEERGLEGVRDAVVALESQGPA